MSIFCFLFVCPMYKKGSLKLIFLFFFFLLSQTAVARQRHSLYRRSRDRVCGLLFIVVVVVKCVTSTYLPKLTCLCVRKYYNFTSPASSFMLNAEPSSVVDKSMSIDLPFRCNFDRFDVFVSLPHSLPLRRVET